MTVPVPLLRRRRVLAAAIETTVGTAATNSASTAVFNAYDVEINPTIDFMPREGQGGFTELYGTLGGQGGTCKFKTDLYGGTSTVPQMFSTLMPACGYVAATDVFSCVSGAPGGASGVKTITISVYEDGVIKQLVGAMGTWVMTMPAGKPVSVEWTFTGIWEAPIAGALISPTYPVASPLRFVSSGLSINSFVPRVAELTLDAGNTVILREDSTTATGYLSAVITGRRITGKIDPEATLVATYDQYGDWLALTQGALAIALGTTGNGVAIAAPALQVTKVEEGDRDKLQIDNVEFLLVNGGAVDDDMTFTLS